MSKNLTETEFLQIYDEYKDKIYNQAYRILGTKEDAEEAVQDVFMRIYKSYGSFEGRAKLSSWIYRIAVNVCISKTAQRKKNIDYFEERQDIAHCLKEKSRNPEELFQSNELRELFFDKFCEELQNFMIYWISEKGEFIINKTILEDLASIQHDIWSDWINWMISIGREDEGGNLTIYSRYFEKIPG